tara:strand:- start:473 stop:1216 length:744 start_codon:yes stop_codon:yes gene_type:complete
MIHRFPTLVVILSFCIVGCLTEKSEKILETAEANTPQVEEAKPIVAGLSLSLAKPNYQPTEPIHLNMTIKTGKFDLLAPYVTAGGTGAFTKLVVKNEAGETIKPKHPITMANESKTLIWKGKEARCIRGIKLGAKTECQVALDNLRTYYDFTSGIYTLQVLMSLKIYRDFLEDQSLQIVEIEREIAEVQGSKKLPTDAKQEVTTRLREEIEYIQSQEKERSDRIYLPLDSYRGSTNLESNIINLNIE